MNYGERLADRFAAVIGSWRFIILQSVILFTWVLLNVAGIVSFDKYPFILLNLFLSFQAAYTGPVLLMSANRQANKDRKRDVKNLVVDQQGHAILVKLEEHIHLHMHELRKEVKQILENQNGGLAQ